MLAFLTFFAVSLRHTEIIFTKTLWLKCKTFICTRLNLCLSERYKKQFLTEMCWTIQHRMQWSTVNRTMQGWDKYVFTDYTFVNGRRRTKRIVLDNIKPREVLVEDVKTDIREWYEDKDKNVTVWYISSCSPFSKRNPHFCNPWNIDVDDDDDDDGYEKPQNSDFWQEPSSWEIDLFACIEKLNLNDRKSDGSDIFTHFYDPVLLESTWSV